MMAKMKMMLMMFLMLMMNVVVEGNSPTGIKAFWVEPFLIALRDPAQWGVFFELHYNLNGPVDVPQNEGRGIKAIYERHLTRDSYPSFPNLDGYLALRLQTADLSLVRSILKGDSAIGSYLNGNYKESTRIQIQGVLDNLYQTKQQLGVKIEGTSVSLNLWAPTSRSVSALLFSSPDSPSPFQNASLSFDQSSGIWSAQRPSSEWLNKYYLYEVEVYVPEVLKVVVNIVTDPYSVSLSTDGKRSQIIDILNDPAYKPSGWDSLKKPELQSWADIVVYELHVRDFSVFDESIPQEHRGTYNAFDYNGVGGRNTSNGMRHLLNLQEAGFTHLHLLPTYDIGSIPEDRANQRNPDPNYLATFPGDSEQQQRIVGETREIDAYNWGYDPVHFGAPEGSYAVPEEQNGGARILRYRKMIQRLNEVGYRVVQDVVYNHVFRFGQNSNSVIDKIVPGYYLRMNNDGVVQQQSCCPDLATEFFMVERLMIDHLVHWAVAFKIDSFRFDLMGFHTVDNVKNIISRLESLTLEENGVNGKEIYLYGEGWDFGSAKQKGFAIASQWGVAGLGIGTFNDNIRDAVHGGSREDPLAIRSQGFINGLSYDWNGYYYDGRYQGDLRYKVDVIRLGLVGNLQNYAIIDQNGNRVLGKDFNRVGYTLSPRECINYHSSHDDQSLFDLNVFKSPSSTSREMRSRTQNMAMSLVGLAQGIPFFDSGVDMMRSKSLDRDSYDSGDWFNALDFTYSRNSFAIGMPAHWRNEERWDILPPILRDSSIAPTRADIIRSVEHLKEIVRIRKSSKLFRLSSQSEISSRVSFFNTGPNQIDALIVMLIDNTVKDLPVIENDYQKILCVFNADKNEKRITLSQLRGNSFVLHPVFASSYDSTVKNSNFNSGSGEVYVPAKTTAVFVF